MEPKVKGYTCWGTHLLSDHGQHLDVDTVADRARQDTQHTQSRQVEHVGHVHHTE